ncbi:hypothetical protein ACHWQZ_G000612 [Mnemiopsis leidyi]
MDETADQLFEKVRTLLETEGEESTKFLAGINQILPQVAVKEEPEAVNLEEDEKRNCALFCEIYKKAIYGTDSVPLKNEVLECKQEIVAKEGSNPLSNKSLPISGKHKVKLARKERNSINLQPGFGNQIIVNATCAEQPVNLLIDTGAAMSLVNTRFIIQSNLMNSVQPTKTSIAGIDKNVIPLRGQINLSVTIGDQVTSHCYGIFDTLDNEFLIGLDFLNKIDANIDIPSKTLRLPGGFVDFINKPIGIKNRSKIRCNKNVTLKANTMGYIWGKIAICNARDNYEGVVEPYHQLANKSGVFVTGTISYSKKSLIPIHYVNVMDNDVTLYKNQLVAFLEPLCKNSRGIKRVNKLSGTNLCEDYSKDIPRLPDALSVDETIENGKWEDPTILHEKLGIDQMEISESGKQDLKSLISDYSHCFARNRFDLGKASFYEARITLKRDFEPQWVPSRPVGYKLEPLMEKEIESMLKADHITRCSYSLWNAQTFLVKKNKGTGPAKGGQPSGEAYRFVQDARALNSQCIQDCYELPRINTILDRMSDCKWLSNLDFQSSFTQIPLRAQDQILTSFQQGGKRYMHTRMVQGQTSSSSQFSRCINHLIMTKIPFDRIILYIDDALLWSPDERSHLLQLRYILSRLTWGNVKLNPDKTRLFQKEVRWLGHWVSSKGVRLDEAKVTAIQSLSPPTTVKQVTIDSSKRGQGATLTQEINGERRVIAYWSRAVPKHQQKFGATRLELIALHGALKHWKIYLMGTKFVVFTDCKALLSLSKIFRNENSFFQRRLSDLAMFNFELKHIKGTSADMSMADFLSRHGFDNTTREASTQTDRTEKVSKILRISQDDSKKPVTISEIRKEYVNDRILSTVIDWVRTGGQKPCEREFNHRSQPDELQHYWKDFELLKLEDGVLYRKWYDTISRETRSLIVVPCTLVERVLYTFHDTIATCHAGVQPCIERCMKQFYFYKLKREFELYIGSCVTCGRAKQPTTFSRAPLKSITYTEFNQCISIDHLEPSKTPTARGNVALLTICDHFTNYLVCVPVRSTGAEASIKAVLEHWILKHGVPEVVMHDLGSAFTSGLWKAVMKAFNIKDVKTTPKFSQSNGKAESMNRRLNQCFRVTLDDKNWKNYDIFVKYIVFCLNSLASTRTGLTPNFLVYGRELRMPRDLFVNDTDRIDQMLASSSDQDYQVTKSAYDLYKSISHVTRVARDNSQRRAKYMAKQYDKRVRGPYFKAGDWCFLLELWPKHKYADTWRGPYKVVKALNDHNYVVEVEGKEKVVSISKMKPYRLNKHSEIGLESDKKPVPEPKQPVTQNKRRKDSSSDEGSVIITWDIPPPRRSNRLAEKRQKSDYQTLPQPSSTTVSTTVDNVTTAPDVETTIALPDTGRTQESSLISAVSESDQDFVDAEEVLNEKEPDTQIQSGARDSSPFSVKEQQRSAEVPGSINIPGSSRSRLRFGEINTPLSLRDITDQERIRRGITPSFNPLPSTTRSGLSFRGGTKAAKVGDKTKASSSKVTTPDNNSDSGKSSFPYNLRSRSKATKGTSQTSISKKADSGKAKKSKSEN